MSTVSSAAIGVFDSGVGGLTVVAALRKSLPSEHIVYLGDTARLPYGSKSPRTVERYSLACQQFLLDRHVKLVLVACNTASATAIDALRAAAPVQVIGAVVPGATSALAATVNNHIGVIGTLATIRSRAYELAISQRSADAVVSCLATPLLVPLAEEGWSEGDVASAVARRYLHELFSADPQIDTLVLGCTHYPLLASTLHTVAEQLSGRAIAVVDSATAMASATAAMLGHPRQENRDGTLRAFVTDASRLDELAPRFLGEPLASCELVDL